MEAIEQAFANAAKEVKSAEGKRGSVRFDGRLDYEVVSRSIPSEPCVQLAEAAVAAVGREPLRAISNGGLDANWLNAHGIPTVTLGCGQMNVHTTSEMLDLAAFRDACRIALCGWQQSCVGQVTAMSARRRTLPVLSRDEAESRQLHPHREAQAAGAAQRVLWRGHGLRLVPAVSGTAVRAGGAGRRNERRFSDARRIREDARQIRPRRRRHAAARRSARCPNDDD